MGGKVVAVCILWVRSGNDSSGAGTRLHLMKEHTLSLGTVCIERWDFWMEECSAQKKEFLAVK